MHINSNLFAGMQKSQTNSTRSHSTTQTQYRMFNHDMMREIFSSKHAPVCVFVFQTAISIGTGLQFNPTTRDNIECP